MTALCPCCGAPAVQSDLLLAVCDVLVVKALETMGKWLIRVGGRSRMGEFAASDLLLHEAHTRWQDTDDIVSRALRGAWDVVPAMLDVHGCCGATSSATTAMLDAYVHDLVITGTTHTLEELAYRFRSRLNLYVAEVPHG